MIERFQHLLFEMPAWLLITIIATLVLIRTGIWYIPDTEVSVQIATNPFTNPFLSPGMQYLYWNWLGPFLAWLIGIRSKWEFILVHFCFSLAFSILFIKVIFHRFSDRSARKSLMLFSILPVSATAYFWVGMDSITLFLMLVSLITPRFALIVGFALGLQHFEQGFFAVAGLLCAVALDVRMGEPAGVSTCFCFALLAGVILGKLFLIGLVWYFHIDVNSGREFVLSKSWKWYFREFAFHFPYIIWSILGIGWIVMLRYINFDIRSWGFISAFFFLCGFAAIVDDQTRVVCILTFPLVAVYWLLNNQFLDRIDDGELTMFFLIWILTPWAWVWQGIPRWSVFPYDISFVAHRLLGLTVPADPYWPFFQH